MSERPWRDRYLVFGAPSFGPEERAAVLECLDSGWVGSGPRVAEFEERFRRYVDAPAAVAVSSCTAALHLALLALDLEPGSEVVTSPMTFAATATAIVHAGHVPVFADCDLATGCLDPAALERAIGPRTRAVVPVHFAGRPCDMAAIGRIAAERGLHVVEDCAHAIEAAVDGRHCGTFGELGCFSFYVTKNVTSVEGGMLVARSRETAARLKTLALHGLSADAWRRYGDEGFVHYQVEQPGFKYNMTDLAAAIALVQLGKVEAHWQRRRALWDFYLRELAELPLELPAPFAPGTRHALHLFTCRVDPARTARTRDEVVQALHGLRIGSGVHYTALHLHPWYRKRFGHEPGDFPSAESIGARTFSIPLSPAVSDADAADVVRALRIALA
ncbi:MAG: UDP-4-amino-4,6-dideoxy-N-acetyl-beta-L-altrosamine transaminase [Proteobacteria bacterium]|nr:MAG: UDP-4-amino-4,6-dideoxy-N-acetyl-beta-L-altrosamine transaminase [Pseudomonadota bacterium]